MVDCGRAGPRQTLYSDGCRPLSAIERPKHKSCAMWALNVGDLVVRGGCLVSFSGRAWRRAASLDGLHNNSESTVSDTEYFLEKVVVSTTYWHAFRQDEPPVQMFNSAAFAAAAPHED